ncbi:MAG: hypothetical protein C4523_00560 [Myxococcales bacterium]|nr:MAG: hypothetical protein C4523_00560 [Myxococcales bacterium]
MDQAQAKAAGAAETLIDDDDFRIISQGELVVAFDASGGLVKRTATVLAYGFIAFPLGGLFLVLAQGLDYWRIGAAVASGALVCFAVSFALFRVVAARRRRSGDPIVWSADRDKGWLLDGAGQPLAPAVEAKADLDIVLVSADDRYLVNRYKFRLTYRDRKTLLFDTIDYPRTLRFVALLRELRVGGIGDWEAWIRQAEKLEQG